MCQGNVGGVEVVDDRLVPDRARPGAWLLHMGGTDHSYVDPYDPAYLEFDYVQRIADVIDITFPPGERITVIHVGGGAMTLPRYVAHTRPTSNQIVFEPDASLTAAVAKVVPLPRFSGIKVRPLDGRSGIATIANQYADLVIVDAFDGARVPADLGTDEWFAQLRRVIAPGGTLVMNLTDEAPFAYSRRVIAGIIARFDPVAADAESSTWNGRRLGNFVVSAGGALDVHQLRRHAAGAAYPHRVIDGPELDRWLGGAVPFTDDDAQESLPITGGSTTFR